MICPAVSTWEKKEIKMASFEGNELEATEQHLKSVKIAIEFKYLTRQAPAGVYLLPEVDNIRILHGVIFLRRGLYADGVFRFRIELPPTYNDKNTHPRIIFTPPIFSPFIDMTTGELCLTTEETLKEWNPDKHFIITAITFLKKSFYAKSYDGYAHVPNEEARQM
jgi:ubiquitin-protein ligase